MQKEASLKGSFFFFFFVESQDINWRILEEKC